VGGGVRCFLGLALPEEARRTLETAFAPLRARLSGRGCRWVPPENLHLTLRFLGECDRARLDRVTTLAAAVVQEMEAPAIHLAEPGAFPPRGRRPLVLWAGVGGDLAALARLAAALEEAARAAGFRPEPRAFRAHVTLARIEPRHARELDRVVLPALPPVDCSASSVRLFRSLREADGVRYPTLARWRFQRPAPPSTLP